MSWRYSVADLLCGQIQAILILGCLEQISDMKEKDQSIRGSNERASERECRPHADQTGTRRSYENIYIYVYMRVCVYVYVRGSSTPLFAFM